MLRLKISARDAGLHAECPLLLSDINQNEQVSKNLGTIIHSAQTNVI
jgi:hypothetical protein